MGEISDLLFPERCVGCGTSRTLLCKKCSYEWGRSIQNVVAGVPLTSSAYYSSSIAHIVLSAKENNDARARRVLANAISLYIPDNSIVIPIPSSAANNRRRGYDHSYLLAREVSRLSNSRVWSALAVNRKIKDQTRLSHQKRFNNLEGAYSINDSINYSANPGNGSESNLVVIDDLVTSGASLREAVRVLRADKRFAAGIGRNSRQISAVSACVATHHLPNTITP